MFHIRAAYLVATSTEDRENHLDLDGSNVTEAYRRSKRISAARHVRLWIRKGGGAFGQVARNGAARRGVATPSTGAARVYTYVTFRAIQLLRRSWLYRFLGNTNCARLHPRRSLALKRVHVHAGARGRVHIAAPPRGIVSL